MNENAIQEVSKAVATKNPTGKLTASQKQRRLRVAKFIKATEKLPEALQKNAEDMKDDGKLNNSVKKEEDEKEEKKTEASNKNKKAKASADPEAAKYYKELYNSDPEAKTFASDLTKDYVSKKSQASIDKTRMHKAYRVALRQVKLGQIANNHEAVTNQVENLMRMDDDGFDAFSTAIESTAIPTKTEASDRGSLLRSASASTPPQTSGETNTPVVNPRHAQIEDLAQRLGDLGWSVRGRR